MPYTERYSRSILLELSERTSIYRDNKENVENGENIGTEKNHIPDIEM